LGGKREIIPYFPRGLEYGEGRDVEWPLVAVLGWGDSMVLVAFRGVDSRIASDVTQWVYESAMKLYSEIGIVEGFWGLIYFLLAHDASVVESLKEETFWMMKLIVAPRGGEYGETAEVPPLQPAGTVTPRRTTVGVCIKVAQVDDGGKFEVRDVRGEMK